MTETCCLSAPPLMQNSFISHIEVVLKVISDLMTVRLQMQSTSAPLISPNGQLIVWATGPGSQKTLISSEASWHAHKSKGCVTLHWTVTGWEGQNSWRVEERETAGTEKITCIYSYSTLGATELRARWSTAGDPISLRNAWFLYIRRVCLLLLPDRT